MDENTAQLVLVYGRLRIGKTYLINSFFNDNFTFKLTGAYKQDKTTQLNNFKTAYEEATSIKIDCPKGYV